MCGHVTTCVNAVTTTIEVSGMCTEGMLLILALLPQMQLDTHVYDLHNSAFHSSTQSHNLPAHILDYMF